MKKTKATKRAKATKRSKATRTPTSSTQQDDVQGDDSPRTLSRSGMAAVHGGAIDLSNDANISLQSSRAVKDDIVYVTDAERAALAQQALAIPLASYRYEEEPPDARRRLGFIIEDQPDVSPAVLADRAHVDIYGYASMLLAAVQQQAAELAALRDRLDRLDAPPPVRARRRSSD